MIMTRLTDVTTVIDIDILEAPKSSRRPWIPCPATRQYQARSAYRGGAWEQMRRYCEMDAMAISVPRVIIAVDPATPVPCESEQAKDRLNRPVALAPVIIGVNVGKSMLAADLSKLEERIIAKNPALAVGYDPMFASPGHPNAPAPLLPMKHEDYPLSKQYGSRGVLLSSELDCMCPKAIDGTPGILVRDVLNALSDGVACVFQAEDDWASAAFVAEPERPAVDFLAITALMSGGKR